MEQMLQTMLLCMMDYISCSVFTGMFFRHRESKKSWKSLLPVLLQCMIATVVSKGLREHFVLKIFVIICVMTVFMVTRYEGKVWKIFLAVTGFSVMILAADFMLLVLLENTILHWWSVIYQSDVYITLVSVTAKMLEFVMMIWFQRRFSRENLFYQLGNSEWKQFLLFNVFSIMALMFVITDEGCREETALILFFDFMILNVLFYYSLQSIMQKEKEKREYRIMQEKINGQLELYRYMEDVYREQRKQTHEFKNHLHCIQGLLEEKRTDEAMDYVGKISLKNLEKDNPVKTGNHILDVVINQRLRETKRKDITMVLKLDALKYFPLRDEDIVILFANLLDNAMEACQRLEREDRIIKVRLSSTEERLVLTVSNKTKEPMEIIGQLIETTKKNKLEHGIGMGNIREVIRRYDGLGKCECREGWFIYTIVFGGQK